MLTSGTGISDQKRALLKRWTQLPKEAKKPTIPLRQTEGPSVLSFGQQRLWFLEQLVPGLPTYNMALGYRFRGPLDTELLEKSLNEVVRRHEVLRTEFLSIDEEPRQLVLPTLKVSIAMTDISSKSATDQDKLVGEMARAEGEKTFDLTTAPLFRARLLKLADDHHVLLFTIHHIVFDGWSMGLFADEVIAIYESLHSGTPHSLPALSLQYADYSSWQRQQDLLAKEISYWKKTLSGEIATLKLPTDRTRPSIPTFQGKWKAFTLSPDLSRGLKELSQREGVSLFMTLTAAFQTLLHRYSGQEDICIGSPIAGREHTQLEPLIGFFVNTLVFRTNVAGNPSFRELLGRVREVATGAYGNANLPFEKLVEELGVARNMSSTPLFQVMLALQNTPRTGGGLSGLRVEPVLRHSGTSKFDLWMSLWDEVSDFGGEPWLEGELEYNSDLFDDERIDRLLANFTMLLHGIVDNADTRLLELPILDAKEARKIVVDWNATQKTYSEPHTLTELFANQVAKTPFASALVFENEKLSYQDLDERTNQIARRLLKLGVAPNTRVGVCMERSVEMVLALWGVLKAGAGYVPLDPAYPKDRLEYMVADSSVEVLIADESSLAALPPHKAKLLVPSRESFEEDTGALSTRPAQEDLAYMIYTSGSTGKPKGVLVPHVAIANRLLWMQDAYGLTPFDRVLQKTPFSFDVSVWEFFWPAIIGATLVVAKPEGHKDAEYLVELIQDENITTLHFVPPMLSAFLEQAEVGSCPSLKRVFCSGEELPRKTVDAFFAKFDCELHNLYGPTEAAVDVTFWECEKSTTRRTVPIGRPIKNIQTYILDSVLQPVPVGVPGELHLGGIGLAWGYLNRAELTAEKFIPNPFGDAASRLYKTGDLARYAEDGAIEFLGRVDHQVKVRGFRIETGEIESAIRQHPGVSNTIVLAPKDKDGARQLVAYVVPRVGGWETSSSEQLTQWQEVFDETYKGTDSSDPLFNIVGWNSSYTGEPLAPEVMQEWVDQTVDRILSTKPSSVLEVGVGTGLLLARVAPHVTRFYGTDISKRAIELLEKHRAALSHDKLDLQLLHRAAHELDDLPQNAFDVIVVNSVVQYFPSSEYLTKFLRKMTTKLTPNGVIFLGDIRNLAHLRTFHSAVEVQKAPSSQPLSTVVALIDQKTNEENELNLDPGFFESLKKEIPEIKNVDVLLKRGKDRNELTQFRYDVFLRSSESPIQDVEWTTVDEIHAKLHAGIACFGVQEVPNARISTEVETEKVLKRGKLGTLSVEEVKERYAKERAGSDPDKLSRFAEAHGYASEIHWAADGHFHIVFKKSAELSSVALPSLESTRVPFNNPLLEKAARALVPELKDRLKETLPDYMVPQHYLCLNALPLSPNGKVDREALPLPAEQNKSIAQFIAPSTPFETGLAAIWGQVLGLEKIGLEDNFFGLGGDSIKSIQVVSRSLKAGIKITAKHIFQNQTLRELASVATSLGTATKLVANTDAKESEAVLRALSVKPEVIDAIYPLAPFQRFQLHQLRTEPKPGLYVLWQVLSLKGPFARPLFEKAWDQMMKRHAPLRTSFVWEGVESPKQVVWKDVPVPYEYVDIRGVEAADQESQIMSTVQAFRSKGFKLGNPGQFQLTLFHLGENDHRLFWAFNYMLYDGWSGYRMMAELFTIYRKLQSSESTALPELRAYGDYQQWLSEQDQPAAEAFWKTTMEGFTKPVPLSEKLPGNRPEKQDFAKETMSLTEADTQALDAFSREHRLTTSTLVHGAWALLMKRYTGVNDQVFGTIVSGRPPELEGVESMVGHFNNLLPLRLFIDEKQSVIQWLQGVQNRQVEARQFEYSQPLASGVAPFQSYVVFENFPIEEAASVGIPELETEYLHSINQLGLPLRVEIWPDAGLYFVLQYYERFFDKTSVRGMLSDIEAMLRQIRENPKATVGSLC